MVASNQLTVFFLLLIVSQVPAQNYFKPSITCYMKYDHEESKTQASNNVLSYAYSQSEITQFITPEGEPCSSVGCACFSYKSICAPSLPQSNHFSQCTDTDRRQRTAKWHRGWASNTKCDQMRQQPQAYPDLTCCYTDRCNDQPGKITKIVDSPVPYQPYQRQDTYAHPTPAHAHLAHKPSQRYENPVHRSSTYTPVTAQPSQSFEKSLPPNSSVSAVYFSSWMICFALVFRFIVAIQSY